MPASPVLRMVCQPALLRDRRNFLGQGLPEPPRVFRREQRPRLRTRFDILRMLLELPSTQLFVRGPVPVKLKMWCLCRPRFGALPSRSNPGIPVRHSAQMSPSFGALPSRSNPGTPVRPLRCTAACPLCRSRSRPAAPPTTCPRSSCASSRF